MTVHIPDSMLDKLAAGETTAVAMAKILKCSEKTICLKIKAMGRQDLIEQLKSNMRDRKYRKSFARTRQAAGMVLQGEKIVVIQHITGCSESTIVSLRKELRELEYK